MHKYRFHWVLTLALLFSWALPVAAAPAGQLRIGLHVDQGALTPYDYTFGHPGLQLVRIIYDTLFIMNQDRQPEPWMVREYQVSADGREWTLTLHEGITFHDDQPLTAHDVAFTYTFMRDPSHSIWRRAVSLVQDMEVVDDRTIIFRLAEPHPRFLRRPLSEVPILPAHIWKDVTEPRSFTDATGSGPYRVSEYRSGQFYRLQAHAQYFHPDYAPALESIILPIISDQTTLFSALRAGEVDMATQEVPPELVADLYRPGEVHLARGPLFTSQLLIMNNSEPPFNSVRFRQAIALMIDTEYLVDTLRLGYGLPGNLGFVHPRSPWLNQEIPAHPQDLPRARSVLDELGYRDANGDGYREDPQGQALSLNILAYAERPERVRTAEIIASWLKEAGLRAQVQAMEAGTVDSLVWPGFDVTQGRDFQLATWGWSAGIQEMPLSLREVLHGDGTLNVVAFRDGELDGSADQLLTASSEEEMVATVSAMAARAAASVPLVTLWYPESIYAYRPAAYDGWTFVRGLGILDKWSLITERSPASPTPAPGEESVLPEELSPLAWLIGAAALILGVGLMRRRSRQP